jgi:CTD small phosphatase-like protein 2
MKMYTLVLDLDETLIHFQSGQADDEEGFYMIRPGCNKFLKELSQLYEIVVFTAAMPDYADWILNQIDEQGFIAYRLYRQHCSPKEDYAIKDLRLLGRDLARTIIVDNLAENFSMTESNGIWVESWYDDLECRVLPTL